MDLGLMRFEVRDILISVLVEPYNSDHQTPIASAAFIGALAEEPRSPPERWRSCSKCLEHFELEFASSGFPKIGDPNIVP